MSDADCTPGREPRSVAASLILFSNFGHHVLFFLESSDIVFSLFVFLNLIGHNMIENNQKRKYYTTHITKRREALTRLDFT